MPVFQTIPLCYDLGSYVSPTAGRWVAGLGGVVQTLQTQWVKAETPRYAVTWQDGPTGSKTAQTLATVSAWAVTIKAQNNFGAATLLYSTAAPDINGTLYTFTLPNYNTTQLADAFVILDADIESLGDDGQLPTLPADQAERYALTDLAKGYIVRQVDTGTYWRVIDTENLDNSAGWTNTVVQRSYVDCGLQIDFTIAGVKDKTRALSVRINNDYAQTAAGATPIGSFPVLVDESNVLISPNATDFYAANPPTGGGGSDLIPVTAADETALLALAPTAAGQIGVTLTIPAGLYYATGTNVGDWNFSWTTGSLELVNDLSAGGTISGATLNISGAAAFAGFASSANGAITVTTPMLTLADPARSAALSLAADVTDTLHQFGCFGINLKATPTGLLAITNSVTGWGLAIERNYLSTVGQLQNEAYFCTIGQARPMEIGYCDLVAATVTGIANGSGTSVVSYNGADVTDFLRADIRFKFPTLVGGSGGISTSTWYYVKTLVTGAGGTSGTFTYSATKGGAAITTHTATSGTLQRGGYGGINFKVPVTFDPLNYDDPTAAQTAVQINGTVAATLFSGSGASLTNLPVSVLTGLGTGVATALAVNTGTSGSFLVTTGAGTVNASVIGAGTLPSARGGTGVSNAGTITNASNTTITGGGTLALGGFTATIPATDTVAMLSVSNTFTGTVNNFPAGSSAAPSIIVGGSGGTTNKTGFWNNGGLSMGSNGAECIRVDSGGALVYAFQRIQMFSSLGIIGIGSAGDLGISRNAAGVLQIGSSPSSGNASGSLLLTNLTASGAIITTPQALSGAGAVDVVTAATAFTSTGAANALTLANGTNGQEKTISHVVKGTLGTGVLTPTTANGFSTITFTNAGDSVLLKYYTSGGWCIIGSRGVTIA